MIFFLNILDLVNTAKNGPGSKMIDRVEAFWLFNKNNQES